MSFFNKRIKKDVQNTAFDIASAAGSLQKNIDADVMYGDEISNIRQHYIILKSNLDLLKKYYPELDSNSNSKLL